MELKVECIDFYLAMLHDKAPESARSQNESLPFYRWRAQKLQNLRHRNPANYFDYCQTSPS